MAAPLAAGAAARAAAGAASEPRLLVWLLAAILGIPLALATLIAALLGGLAGEIDTPSVGAYGPSAGALADIPAAYLPLYQAAGSTYGLDWTYLAAIGKIETDHGRLRAPGVSSGVNSYGCCAGPMQFSIVGAGGGTWGAYGVDANGDAIKDVYDPEDAIPAAANYLKASGAPADWSKAIFAYNHAGWYVDQVKRQAERYRGAALAPDGSAAGSAVSQRLPDGARWLQPVPGTSATCDSRIVADVLLLLRRYKMSAGDCFALSGHSGRGEHPLGLGIDLYPGPGGNWQLVARAAHDLGWRAICGSTGCAGQTPSPFRFIGWNGYPNHGDPLHAGANAHLHLSWMHSPAAPGTPAHTVQTLLAP